MRDLSTLFQIVLDEYNNGSSPYICCVISWCETLKVITEQEFERVYIKFKSSHQMARDKFGASTNTSFGAWWPCDDRESRIKFLTYLIDKYKTS